MNTEMLWEHTAKRLREEIAANNTRITKLESDLKCALEALEFYANPDTWNWMNKSDCLQNPSGLGTDSDGPSCVAGNKARAVLTKIRGSEA